MLSMEYLASLWNQHRPTVPAAVKCFEIGGRDFGGEARPALMGVVNLSPDSWYRESVCLSTAAAVRRAAVLHEQGAAMVDIGAESSLAHAARADAALQSSRLLPVIREVRARGILVSVETYELDVARAALEAGANVLNLTGAPADADLYRAVADHEGGVIICYVQGPNVRAVTDFAFSTDTIEMMRQYFGSQIQMAVGAGVRRIFLDPGLGFYYRNLQDSSRRVRHQMEVFLHTFRLCELGWPVCHALPHAFEYFGEEVRTAEPFFAVLAALGQTHLFRTHEVARVKAVLDTMSLLAG